MRSWLLSKKPDDCYQALSATPTQLETTGFWAAIARGMGKFWSGVKYLGRSMMQSIARLFTSSSTHLEAASTFESLTQAVVASGREVAVDKVQSSPDEGDRPSSSQDASPPQDEVPQATGSKAKQFILSSAPSLLLDRICKNTQDDINSKLSTIGSLSVILTYLSDKDLARCRRVNKNWDRTTQKMPIRTQNGFEAKIQHRNGPVYLRMELLTEENSVHWETFRDATTNLLHQKFGSIIQSASQGEEYNDHIKQVTGFSDEEYQLLQKNIRALDPTTQKKVIDTLKGVFGGAVGFHPRLHVASNTKYIVYATNNPDFTIPAGNEQLNYKQYKELYQNILIAFVSDHGSKERKPSSFENRGIFRPLHHILENRYEGLSMLLHGFTGIVAKKFFSTVNFMYVRPLPSMQAILKKTLHRGEACLFERRKKPLPLIVPKGGFKDEDAEFEAIDKCDYEKKDVVDYIEQKKESPQNCIKNSALVRIYGQS